MLWSAVLLLLPSYAHLCFVVVALCQYVVGKSIVMPDRFTVAKVLLPRLSCPIPWPSISTPFPRAQTITEVKSFFPEFNSLHLTSYCLNRYEDLHSALVKPDRVRLIQLLTLAYYDSLFNLNHPKPLIYPKAISGNITGGYIVQAAETGVTWALIALELTLKDAEGTKHYQKAVMERFKDKQFPSTWQFALIEGNS